MAKLPKNLTIKVMGVKQAQKALVKALTFEAEHLKSFGISYPLPRFRKPRYANWAKYLRHKRSFR